MNEGRKPRPGAIKDDSESVPASVSSNISASTSSRASASVDGDRGEPAGMRCESYHGSWHSKMNAACKPPKDVFNQERSSDSAEDAQGAIPGARQAADMVPP
jgi:hypothetical protein